MAILIYTAAQLQGITDLSADYELANDIDLANYSWTPLGSAGTPYSGVFDGKGYAIRNLTISLGATNDVGFFSYVTGGTIRNLNFYNATVLGNNRIAVIAARISSATILNCRIFGASLTGNISGGGCISSEAVNSTITQCGARARVFTASAGGICGFCSGCTVTKCWFDGEAIGNAVNIAGLIYSCISNTNVSICYAKVQTSALTDLSCLIGLFASGSITNCYSVGNGILTSVNSSPIGGLIKTTSSSVSISKCYSDVILSSRDRTLAGGLVGENTSSVISDCFHDSWDNGAGTYASLEELKKHDTFKNFDCGIWGMKENSSTPFLYIENNCNYWTGLGADNNWSTKENWSKNRPPNGFDTVFFNAESNKNCTIDVSSTIDGLNIGLSYSGTITQNQPLTINGDFRQQNGTFVSNASLNILGVSYRLDSGVASGITGNGTVGTPYILTTELHLQAIKYLGLDKYYRLGGSISITGKFAPIGSRLFPFTGNFDGQNYTISLPKIHSVKSYNGLFGSISSSTIQNLNVVGHINGIDYVGGICGNALSSVFTVCTFNGTVGGRSYVGGISGKSTGGTISGCSTSGYVNAINFGGGIVGVSTSTISNCTSNSVIKSDKLNGGFTGSLVSGSVTNNSWARNYNNINSDTNAVSSPFVLPGFTTANWSSIACSADFIRQVAVINNGTAYISEDSGLYWTQRSGSGTKVWESICTDINRTYTIAVASADGLYTTPDHVTWTKRTTGLPATDMVDVKCSNTAVAIITGSFGGASTLFVSGDGGVNFTARAVTGKWSRFAINAAGNIMYACRDENYVYISTNTGVAWTTTSLAILTGQTWKGICCSSDGRIVYANTATEIFASFDFGLSWIRVYTGSGLGRIYCSTDGSFVSTYNTAVICSVNYGVDWVTLSNPTGSITALALPSNRMDLITYNHSNITNIAVAITGSTIRNVNLNRDTSLALATGDSSNIETVPTKIYDLNDLRNISKNMSGYYELANDIDCSNETITPIGAPSVQNGLITNFTGTLDGKGYKIQNLNILQGSFGLNVVGLFAVLDGSTIKNLTFSNVNINTSFSSFVGIIAGDVIGASTVDNCIVGNCTITPASFNYIGGFFGGAGFVAPCNSIIVNCISSCRINGTGGLYGGFVGGSLSNGGSITLEKCISMSNINGSSQLGGLVGGTNSVLNLVALDCSFLGVITGTGTDIGGIFGNWASNATVSLTNCYSNGTLTGTTTCGGLGGRSTNAGSSIVRCYSSSTNTFGSSSGGLVATGFTGTITNSYHNGTDNSLGTVKTTAELRQHATYSGWNWGLWSLDENSTIPILYTNTFANYWTGLGADNNWSTRGNWSKNRIPNETDNVIFGSFSTKNCTIDVQTVIKSLHIGSNYSGAITQNASVVISNDFYKQNGNWTQNESMTVKGIFTNISGNFVCSTPNTVPLTVIGAFSNSSNTFSRVTGAGTVGDPYLIYDGFGLDKCQWHVVAYFRLNNSIVCPKTFCISNTFNGNFNGNGFSISGISLARTYPSRNGLFLLLNGATVKNLTIKKSTIISDYNSGFIAAKAEGSFSIYNCHVDETCFLNGRGGGILGESGYQSSGSIYNCSNKSTVTYYMNASANYAGILGVIGQESNTSIYNCFNSGNILGSNKVGGIFGSMHLDSTINVWNCYNSGYISQQSGYISSGIGNTSNFATQFNIWNSYHSAIINSGGAGGNGSFYSGTLNPSTSLNNWTNSSVVSVGPNSTGIIKETDYQNFYDPLHPVYTTSNDHGPWDFVNVWEATDTYPKLRTRLM